MRRTYIVCECDRCHKTIEGEPIKISAAQTGRPVQMVCDTLIEKDFCIDCVAEMLEFLVPQKAPEPMTLEEFTEKVTRISKNSEKEHDPKEKAPRLKKDGTPWGKSGRKPQNEDDGTREAASLPKLKKGTRAFELTDKERRCLKMWKAGTVTKDIAKTLDITEDDVDDILLKYANPNE